MTDRYAWTQAAASAARHGNPAEIDMHTLAEELDQMARSDAREVRQRITVILEHLLKLRLATGAELGRCRRGWAKTAITQRAEIDAMFEESPSLRRIVTPEMIAKAYHAAALAVAGDFAEEPPAECPFTREEIIG